MDAGHTLTISAHYGDSIVADCPGDVSHLFGFGIYILDGKIMATKTVDQISAEFDLQLCWRDYNLMAEHQPKLLATLEALVNIGATDDTIRRLAYRRLTDESLLTQRIMNAAHWIRNSDAA